MIDGGRQRLRVGKNEEVIVKWDKVSDTQDKQVPIANNTILHI